LDRWTDSKTYS